MKRPGSLLGRGGPLRLQLLPARSVVLSVLCGLSSCYSTGGGIAPPAKSFYFPVGLAVSPGGNVLYAVNSDFDLQYNGGTLQSYDLHLIRRDAANAVLNPAPGCPSNPPLFNAGGGRQVIGETCAPPVDSTRYVRDSATIGAFATDLQIVTRDLGVGSQATRLFAPTRGDASLTWADVVSDRFEDVPPEQPSSGYGPFKLDCGVRVDNRCDAAHHAGNNPNEPGNTRNITMPGEPFGMAVNEAASAIAITHQNDTKTSLFSTGLDANPPASPALQFILDGVAIGGNGIAAIPQDVDALPGCAPSGPPCVRPAFLETSRSVAEISRLRYFSDEGYAVSSSLQRPFLVKDAVFPLTANVGGSDSRAIVIDPTPRMACKSAIRPAGGGRTEAEVDAETVACARTPARVFIASRSPSSLLVGQVGEEAAASDGSYDPDSLTIYASLPLSAGPSRVYLAPVVVPDRREPDPAKRRGVYALRVFVVCFDANTVFVYDPEAGRVENVIRVSSGPFAMAFDPFRLEDVAANAVVTDDVRSPGLDLKTYRFAYIASFTKSFVQVLDLDNSRTDKTTFQTVVFTLGTPTLPKGST